MAFNPQFKINQMAKDMGLKSKELVEILSQNGIEAKTTQKALEPSEFDVLFDALTRANQISNIGDYLDGVTHIPSKVKKEAPKKAAKAETVEEKKAEINKVFPDLTFENAEDQYKKAETERTGLENELKTAKENLKKASEGLDDKKKNLTDVYNKDIEELTKKHQPTLDILRDEKKKLSQQKQEIVNAATEKAIQAMKQDGKAEEKGKIVFDEKTNSDIAALDQQINKISGELKKGERQFNFDKKKITDTYSAEVKKLETPVEMNSRKVRMIMNKVNGKKNLMEAAKKFMNHAEYCGTVALDAALEKANVMEKLDINAVMQSVQNTAASLMKMAELDGETHKNSKEFNTMVRDLKVVMNWGKDDTVKNSMINPPHTMEQALEKLKASSKKYLEEKTGKTAVCLPSTSPANAAWSIDKLVSAWSVINEYM